MDGFKQARRRKKGETTVPPPTPPGPPTLAQVARPTTQREKEKQARALAALLRG